MVLQRTALTITLLSSFALAPVVFAADEGLVAHWTFDMGNYDDIWVLDASGHNFRGKLIQNPTRDIVAKVKEGIGFNGTTQYVHLESPIVLQGFTDKLTIAGWAMPTREPRGINASVDEATAWDEFVGAGIRRSNLNTFAIGIDLNYKWNATIHAGGSQLANLVSSAERKRGEWQHVALTYDGAIATLYVDGVAVASGAISGNLDISDVFFGIGAKPVFGTYSAVAGDFFEGQADDVRLYNRALSASEVNDLYNLREPQASSAPTTITAPTTTVSELPAAPTVLPSETVTTSPVSIGELREMYPTFTLDLTIGSFNSEVLELQKFLNRLGFKVAASGPGSPDNETKYFGALTKAAVQKFQAAYGIPSTGFVGPLTRAKLNKLLADGATAGGEQATIDALLKKVTELQAELKYLQGVSE